MKKRYYLIDTENVGDRWVGFIGNLNKEDILVVFYTKNHSRLLEEHYLKQRYNTQIRWVECVAGNNALDHQLVGVLSYLIATHTDAAYSIYSNDKDYKNVIDFWKQRNVDIGRVGYDPAKKKDKDGDKEQGKDKEQNKNKDADKGKSQNKNKGANKGKGQNKDKKKSPAAAAARIPETPDMDGMAEEQAIMEIAKAVPVSDMGDWYAVLVALLGQDAGREHYIRLKEDKKRRQELAASLLPDLYARKGYLISLVYSYNGLDTSRAEEALKLIISPKKENNKAIREAFEKHFGKKTKEQAKYFKSLKPLMAIFQKEDNPPE